MMAGEANYISQNWGEYGGDGPQISMTIITSEPLTLDDWRRLSDAMRAIEHFKAELGQPPKEEPF